MNQSWKSNHLQLPAISSCKNNRGEYFVALKSTAKTLLWGFNFWAGSEAPEDQPANMIHDWSTYPPTPNVLPLEKRVK